jgi:hypothetical protein
VLEHADVLKTESNGDVVTAASGNRLADGINRNGADNTIKNRLSINFLGPILYLYQVSFHFQ